MSSLVVPVLHAANNMSNQVVSSVLNVAGGNDHNPLTMSDEHILEICSTHVHSDIKNIDSGSLFAITKNILIRSTHLVDNVFQGNQGSLEQADNKNPPASFTSPLCTLKQIASQMSCKPPGEEIAHKTTLSILNNLSNYEWNAKAVLTLAAFALEYGEFWLLSQHMPTEPLAKSLAIIKQVPRLTNPESLKKHRNAILEISNLVKATCEVIDIIVEFDTLSKGHDIKDLPALVPALGQLPIDVYWAINTIAAIVTQIDCLITDSSEKRQDLPHFGQKINNLLSKLRKQMSECEEQIEEANYYKILKKLFQTPTEIMEVLKVLIFWKDTPETPIYDGATKTLINIEVFKKKDVFLFISTLDISEEELSILIPIYDHITKIGTQYKILWVPIVEEWNDQLCKKFEVLKSKMPWYVLNYFSPIKGIKLIKEELQFKKKPLVVVLNPKGKILHPNAFLMIQIWGIKGFPLTADREDSLIQSMIWIDSLVSGFDTKFNWEAKNHVIIYGGKDTKWIKNFTENATILAKNVKEANVSIELLSLESDQQPNLISNFWKGVESLFVTMMNKTSNTITQQVEKLLSYKNNETGWALLTKGHNVVFVGHGTTVLQTIEKFHEWKDSVTNKGFEIAFKEEHNKNASTVHICSHFEIPNIAGKFPDTIECPVCHGTMEVFISYKCCHNGNNVDVEN